MHDPLDAKTNVHDAYHFEVKLDVVFEAQKLAKYTVATYFFIPRSLGISSSSYPSGAFYGDIQNYIRFKTPVIALASLLDPQNPDSPFTRLENSL